MSTKPNTGLSLIEEEMQREIANIRDQISAPTGSRLSINDQGEFVGTDGRILGPEITVIVIDFISANRYYARPYNRNQPEPPSCFAFGKVIPNMAPHEKAPEPQDQLCANCRWNQWGSAPTGGNGKACKNTRDLVLMLAMDADEEQVDFMTFSVAPTSIKSFDALVRYAADIYESTPVRLLVKMTAIRQGNYFSVQFAPLDENEQYREHFALRNQVQDLLYRIPDYSKGTPAAARVAPRPARR